ncbi:MAG: dihydrofolate reductase [Rikenellaceae bacterium]
MNNTDFTWQIDKFDDVKILRYQIPDFDSLTLQQKTLVYYLSESAKCGRDILFDQNFKHNLSIRKTLEEIYVSYKGDKEDEQFKAFEKYLKKVWFANGIHHHYSSEKFTPEFSEEYFDSLVAATESLKDSKKELAIIKPAIFNAKLYKVGSCQDASKDMIVNSANNYHENLTQKEVEQFYARMGNPNDPEPVMYGLNSRLVKEKGRIFEEVYKIDGKYSAALEKVVYWLEKAAGVAENEHQKQTIEKLISYYKTGDLKEFDEYNVLWVKDTLSSVDFVNGFIEVYGDPLGRKASWESTVNFKNVEATKRTETISDNAQWFEDNSPIDEQYKKKTVKGISAKVITVAQLGGDCFPATPIGINLPNSDWIRKDHGSKSVTIQNITYAYAQAAQGDGFSIEFYPSAEVINNAKNYGTLASDLHTDLHECLGHGSGQLKEGVKGDELKNYASPLEEARADLFALYYIGDTKLMELGIVPSMDVMKAAYYNQIFNGLMGQLTRIEEGKEIVQAHMRNRQLIAAWCYEKGKDENVIEIMKQNGKSYVIINDYEKLRGLFAELLVIIQRVKSEGDYETGKDLIETYAVKPDAKLHKEVLERYATLKTAPYSGFINPNIKPIVENGKIIDVVVEYPDSYVEQMLELREKYSFL